ncbi:competence type IV pilus minor pilin ComGG [Fredinandcohnia humi]
MKNEKGFILPVTVAISFLFFLVFTFQLNMYVTERAFYKETEELLILDNLMQIGVSDVLDGLLHTETIETINTLVEYPNGTVTFSFSTLSATKTKVIVSCITTNHRKYSAEFTYNHETKKMENWLDHR